MMFSGSEFSWSAFNQMPIVGIARNIEPDSVFNMVPGFLSAGLTTLEITMNTSGATSMIAELKNEYKDRMNIGAGTVRNLYDLELALKAGATFIVTPILDEQVIKECVRLEIPVFPGAYTPTEIYRAWNWGAPIVKVFPATALGPTYFKDVLGPLNEIKLMPTGGVSLDSLPGFFNAGAYGFGIGSPLFPKNMVENRDWHGLKVHFERFTALIAELRVTKNQAG